MTAGEGPLSRDEPMDPGSPVLTRDELGYIYQTCEVFLGVVSPRDFYITGCVIRHNKAITLTRSPQRDRASGVLCDVT